VLRLTNVDFAHQALVVDGFWVALVRCPRRARVVATDQEENRFGIGVVETEPVVSVRLNEDRPAVGVRVT
jgi:hypothetical protein